MSAIAGILRFDGKPADRRDVERMMNTLRSYGPDRSGTHMAGPISLGHVLMRMTPEDSLDAQPVRGASGAVMVADLRLDNRDDLTTALGLDPQRAMVSPDSAIVLAAWEKWGNDIWARLRGPFALAIWDARNRLLTLARDPVGLRALCYYHGPNFLAFATMPKALFSLPDVPRELNKRKIADFLVLNHSDTQASVYQDIFRLPAAHTAVINVEGERTKRRYWGEENIVPVRLGSDQEYADAMRERLDRAVRRQLRTTHKVGCMLSGGLDSSAIAALAARALAEQGKRLPAYTQVPADDFNRPNTPTQCFDERPYVEAIAAMTGSIDVTYVRSGECDDFADLERVFEASDGPVHNPQNMGWFLQIYRLAHGNDQRVLLTGVTGNATISWEGWDQAIDHLARGRLWTALKQYALLYRLSMRSPLGAFQQLFVESSPAARIARWTRRPSHSAISAQFAKEMQVIDRAHQDRRKRPVKLGSSTLAHRVRLITNMESNGEWQAGMLALYGVDTRDPTADLDVVEFCLGIPDEQYLAEGIDRSLVRRAMWGLVPRSVLTKRKRGIQAADWFGKMSRTKDILSEEISDLRKSALAAEAIDLEQLDRLLRNLPGQFPRTRADKEAYELALPRGLGIGSFLRFFERNNLSGGLSRRRFDPRLNDQ
jgi:asparagine synthase (glutamine-hydrolysing)